MAGVFNRPFGHEIGYSTSGLESPERATIIQYFFPDERDLGAMLTLRLKRQARSVFSVSMPDCSPVTASIGKQTAAKTSSAAWEPKRKSATGENGEQASPTTTAEFTTRRQPPTNSRIKIHRSRQRRNRYIHET